MKRILPSASNAHLRMACVGSWELIQLLRSSGKVSEQPTQAALDGIEIHSARETGAEVPEHLAKTKEMLDDMETLLVRTWDPDPVLLGREQRLWLRRGITPIHTGKFDYAYRSSDWVRILVADDKTGRLEVAEADVNDQMRELAALVYYNYPDAQEITVAVCQPWISREPSVAVYSSREAELALLLLRKNLADIADPHAIRTPGPHCAYCPAAPYCEENRLMINAVIALADRIKKGDYQLPVGKWGTVFLDRTLTAQKILELIVDKYKALVKSDPESIPGFYLKEGATRHLITDPVGVLYALDWPIEEFIRCGKYTLSGLVKGYVEYADDSEQTAADAETNIRKKCEKYIKAVQNEPSLARESPRRGKPKELIQAELLE